MKALDLSLRQKQILHIMQHTNEDVTSAALGNQLGVSSRTVRSDIIKINEALGPYDARILSLKSKGYRFEASDTKLIESLNQIENTLFTKENRVRYLAFQLCLSEEPLNLYDLEDEMYISHTTLEHAVRDLTYKYVEHEPCIELIKNKGCIEFEENEIKRRKILTEMLRESWNYHGRRNAYYDDDFIDSEVLDYIIDLVSGVLQKYKISLEDPSIVALNLYLAIMYYRISDQHILPWSPTLPKNDMQAYYASQDIIHGMEQHLSCYIMPEEVDQVYLFITANQDYYEKGLDFQTSKARFGPISQAVVSEFLERINDYFGLDFSDDEEFVIALLLYVRNLQRPDRIFNEQFSADMVKKNMRIEMILAELIEDVSLKHTGHYLNQTELIYLAYCLSGALDNYIHSHPQNKLKTIICCHMNMPALWALKRSIISSFGNYLEVTDLLAVYQKSTYDFSKTDLILTTVQKQITSLPDVDTIYISTFLNDVDKAKIEKFILKKSIRNVYSANIPVRPFFEDAVWHEHSRLDSSEKVLKVMENDLLDDGCVGEEYIQNISDHEKNCTYAISPAVALVYSLVPAKKSKLVITTMDHRIIWNSHKVRTIVMAALTKEDMPLLFKLANLIYDDDTELESVKMMKDRDDIIEHYCERGKQ